jgi:Mce-associated membrane protein
VTNTPEEESTAVELTESSAEPEDTAKDAASEDVEATEAADADESDEPDEPAVPAARPAKTVERGRLLAYVVLPVLALLLALVAGWLKFIDNSASDADTARAESVQAAKDGTTALLSYQPATVKQQLTDARKLLTGDFLDSYTTLTTNVVIPGAEQKQISAVANVPAAASVSVAEDHAVVLVFINQTVVVGSDAPTATASSVRVTLDRIDGKWLISKFDPI